MTSEKVIKLECVCVCLGGGGGTVEPLNKGHFGTIHFVLNNEVVLLRRLIMY